MGIKYDVRSKVTHLLSGDRVLLHIFLGAFATEVATDFAKARLFLRKNGQLFAHSPQLFEESPRLFRKRRGEETKTKRGSLPTRREIPEKRRLEMGCRARASGSRGEAAISAHH